MGAETTVLDTNTLNDVIWGIFAVFAIVGAINGLGKGLVRSGVKVASIVLAIVAAFFITPTVLVKAYEIALPYLDDLLTPLAELFSASPTLTEYLPTLAMGLLSPMVFVAVFAVCLLAVAIIRGIINAILKAILPKKPGILSRLGGLALGAVASAMIALCFVFPVTGYFNAVPTIYTNVQEIVSTEENPIAPEVEEVIINLPNVPGIKFVNDTTKQYFDKLVSYTDGETQVSTLDDLTTITSLVPPAMRFAQSVGDVKTMDTQAIREMINIVGDNTKLRTIMAEVVAVASQKWIGNQAFMGINLKAQLDSDSALALDSVLLDLAQTTESTVVDDLNNLADTIDVIKLLYTYADLLQSSTATIAELEAKLAEVLSALNMDTVGLMHDLISADVMAGFGVQNPELVADLVANVVESAVNNTDHEQTAEDAAAINSIMHFAANDGSISAQEVVDDIVHSPAIADAIANAVNVENPPVITVDAEQEQLIADALQSVEDPELVQNLKTLFGIE